MPDPFKESNSGRRKNRGIPVHIDREPLKPRPFYPSRGTEQRPDRLPAYTGIRFPFYAVLTMFTAHTFNSGILQIGS
jgi:hypothetical protein